MNLGPLTFLRKMRSSRKEKLSPQEQQQKGIQKQLLTQEYEAMISDATFSNTFNIPSTPPPYLFDDSTKQTTGTGFRHGNNSPSRFRPDRTFSRKDAPRSWCKLNKEIQQHKDSAVANTNTCKLDKEEAASRRERYLSNECEGMMRTDDTKNLRANASITRTSGHHVSRNAGHTEAMKDLRNLVEIVRVRHQERHIRILRRNSTKMISIAGCGHIVLAD